MSLRIMLDLNNIKIKRLTQYLYFAQNYLQGHFLKNVLSICKYFSFSIICFLIARLILLF